MLKSWESEPPTFVLRRQSMNCRKFGLPAFLTISDSSAFLRQVELSKLALVGSLGESFQVIPWCQLLSVRWVLHTTCRCSQPGSQPQICLQKYNSFLFRNTTFSFNLKLTRYYLNAEISLSNGCRTTMKTKEDVTKFDNWIAGGRKKAAALKLYFLWIKS